MKTQHTQGEWKVGKNPETIECDGDFIATCHHTTEQWITQNQAIANAKIIAAAPELLEALIEVEKWAKTFGMGSIQYEKVINAIKKATE